MNYPVQSILYAYVLAFCFIHVLYVYLLNVPFYVTNEKPLVDLYYKTNYSSNLILDVFLIGLYLAITEIIVRVSKLEKMHYKILLCLVVTLCISGAFYYYFISRPVQSDFFSKWFHTVGFNAVYYDLLLVSSVYGVYLWLFSIFQDVVK